METVTSGQCAAKIGPAAKGDIVKNGFKLLGTPFELDPIKGGMWLFIPNSYIILAVNSFQELLLHRHGFPFNIDIRLIYIHAKLLIWGF